MKLLNNYITEKLKVSKNLKVEYDITFEDFVVIFRKYMYNNENSWDFRLARAYCYNAKVLGCPNSEYYNNNLDKYIDKDIQSIEYFEDSDNNEFIFVKLRDNNKLSICNTEDLYIVFDEGVIQKLYDYFISNY